MLTRLRRLGLLGVGLLVACSSETPSVQEEVTPVAAAVADPELCAEHGVLESVCTQCNPSLAPVFQAKGDWCEEHAFPESFCPICSPELGGRPAVQPTGTDGAPPDGTTVRFRSQDVADKAGLEVAAAEQDDWVEGLEVVARIRWDKTRTAVVSARFPGVVSRVHAQEGELVKTGQLLAEVRSPQVAEDRSRLVAAHRARQVKAEAVERKARLLEDGVGSERSLLEAQEALADAEAEVASLEASLALAGGGQGDRLLLRAPLTGLITARHLETGVTLDAEQALYDLVDPSQVWAELDVPEAELLQVAPGQEVRLHIDAFPDRVFAGTIDTLAPTVDPATRTAWARVGLDNSDGVLRENLYGRATILGQDSVSAVVVPSTAVQRAGEVHLVFVREQDDLYVARRVRVLARQGDRVRIAGGVEASDQVVTIGSFLLKTETLKDSIGAGCCDVE
ncbi:MAG: efflux RND transporter periplasmic adaptor subunit [Proteobacteria bacterium]|nr:efflux RND transporter periplasmic adaptor subunit [Pseudomonadota bacterium]MCP4916131.1 efflux RND transporter periplasmic adaptor subunit [Pseudomonadota bacterium]